MQYSPDKAEVIFFVVAILMTAPIAFLFRSLKKQLLDEGNESEMDK